MLQSHYRNMHWRCYRAFQQRTSL